VFADCNGKQRPLEGCSIDLTSYLTPVFGPNAFRLSRALCALVSLALIVFQSAATTVIAPRFEGLVDRADLIFTGQVTAQRSEWRNNNGQRAIVTLVSFAVQQVHKGRAGSSVMLQFLGGTVGDTTLDVADIPKFKPGERVVLFVEGNGLNASPLVGFYHGKFLVKQDPMGGDRVLQHNGEPLAAVAQLGRAKSAIAGEAMDRGLSHEAFASQIRQRLNGSTK
jgi:hypothetical protein